MEESICQKMFSRIDCSRQSGLSQKAWCEKNDLGYARFHYWYKRYRSAEPASALLGKFVQLVVDHPGSRENYLFVGSVD